MRRVYLPVCLFIYLFILRLPPTRFSSGDEAVKPNYVWCTPTLSAHLWSILTHSRRWFRLTFSCSSFFFVVSPLSLSFNFSFCILKSLSEPMLSSWHQSLCTIPLYIFVLQLGQWSFVGRGGRVNQSHSVDCVSSLSLSQDSAFLSFLEHWSQFHFLFGFFKSSSV